MSDRGWRRHFDDPIPLPRGRKLVALRDAAEYITELPKAEHDAEEWQAAMEALLLVAEHDGPAMFARIGVMKALNRHVERVFNPSRKDTHWGRHKLARDQRWKSKEGEQMEIERYLETIVDPTINDLESNPTSIRCAFLACVVVFHSLDYLTHPDNSRYRRSLFRKQSEDFATVDRVAHALKHVETGHPDAAGNQPLKADDVIERPPAHWGTAVWDLSRWDDATGGVTLDDNRQQDLLSIVKRATAFIRAQIEASKTTRP